MLWDFEDLQPDQNVFDIVVVERNECCPCGAELMGVIRPQMRAGKKANNAHVGGNCGRDTACTILNNDGIRRGGTLVLCSVEK